MDFSSAAGRVACRSGQPSKDRRGPKAYRGKPTSWPPVTLAACSTVLPDVLPSMEDNQFVIGKSLEGGRIHILSFRLDDKLLKTRKLSILPAHL